MTAYCVLLPDELRSEIERAWTHPPKLAEPFVRKPKLNGHLVVVKPARGRRPNRGYEEGVAAEERFFRICAWYLTLGRFPEWYLGMMRGTIDDDANGTDAKARILLDRDREHRSPIQIKSSEEGKDKFRLNPNWKHIICIVVHASYSDEQVFTMLVEELTLDRERRIAGR